MAWLILVLFDFGGDRRVCRRSRADAVAAAGNGAGLGGDPADDVRFDRLNDGDCLPGHAWRCGRTGLSGCPAFTLQMVSGSAADVEARAKVIKAMTCACRFADGPSRAIQRVPIIIL